MLCPVAWFTAALEPGWIVFSANLPVVYVIDVGRGSAAVADDCQLAVRVTVQDVGSQRSPLACAAATSD
jgi:hypothetical protein